MKASCIGHVMMQTSEATIATNHGKPVSIHKNGLHEVFTGKLLELMRTVVWPSHLTFALPTWPAVPRCPSAVGAHRCHESPLPASLCPALPWQPVCNTEDAGWSFVSHEMLACTILLHDRSVGGHLAHSSDSLYLGLYKP